MSTHRTEEVYDTEMAPLITQLIEIAKREGLALFVHAGMLTPDGDALGCVTKIPGADDALKGTNNRHGLCDGIVRGHNGFDRAAGLVITRYHAEGEDVGVRS